MTPDGCDGAGSEILVQGLVVVTSGVLIGNAGFPPIQESGLLPSLLGAASWSNQLGDPLVVSGLVDSARMENVAVLGGECTLKHTGCGLTQALDTFICMT